MVGAQRTSSSPASAAEALPLLELDRVNVWRGENQALHEVTLSVAQGENVAILGPNGCGKSTLLKLLTRELYPHPNSGGVRILGQRRWDVSRLRGTLGIVANDLQAAILPETPVVEAVLAGFTGKLGVYYADESSPERMALAHASLVAADAGHLAGRRYGALSSGEARRVLLARALAHDPKALVLDEPTTSLDLASAHAFLLTLRRLAAEGRSLLLVTHHLEEITPEFSRVVLLKNGRVLRDGAREEVVTSAALSELFEVPVEVTGTTPYTARVVNR